MRRAEPGLSYWRQSVIIYLAVALNIIVDDAGGESVNTVLANGGIWNSGDIRAASTLATVVDNGIYFSAGADHTG